MVRLEHFKPEQGAFGARRSSTLGTGGENEHCSPRKPVVSGMPVHCNMIEASERP
jgi:hypothetical protein